MKILLKPWIFQFFWILLLAVSAHAGDDTSIRLAVLAEDVSPESRALADLLTADLSKTAGIQVVERSEIDRVLAEQKLSAAGLVETVSRIQLGRLLKADGLVLIQKDVARKTRILARLVETKNGFLAGYYQYPFTNVSLDKIARDALADIRSSLSKLRADPAKMQRIAISRIGNATLRADYDWLESDLPVLLAMTFSAEPGILLMERRQLGEALNEATLTGDKGELKTGNVLIDGEVALIYGQIPKDGSIPITMTLRFRDATLKEIGRVSCDGRLTDLDKVATETTALALTKLREIGQRPAEKASAEPEMLLAMAKRHGYVWAADSAYALNPTNTAARNQLITQLLSEALTVEKLARAEKLCREENSLLVNYVQNTQLEGNFIGFLSQPQTMLDADIRAALKPLRETYRRETETQQAGKKPDLIKLLDYAPAFFDNPLDYFVYTRGVYETMARSANTDEDRRKAAIYAITRCIWPPELYFDMADSPDPVIRYFALTKLMRYYGNCVKRKQYALQAADCFDDTLTFSPCLAKMGPRLNDIAPFFHQTIRDMTNDCPALRPTINAKLHAKFNEVLDKKDYRSMLFLEPQNYIPCLPLSNSVPLADRILAEREAVLSGRGYDSTIAYMMIQKVAEWRRTNGNQRATSAGTNEPVKTLVLLSSESPEWRQWAGRLVPAPSALKRNRMVIIPQRFLIDGNILWAGLGGLVPNEPNTYAAGLMKLDLTTGRMLSCRYGKVKWGSWGSSKCVLPILKWHDYIVVGQVGVGVFLYPLQADSSITDLSGVTIINTDSGLLSNQLLSIAALDERLFILTMAGTVKIGKWSEITGSSTWMLFEWHRKTRMVKLLLDSAKQIGGIELPDNIVPKPKMTTDPTNGCLHFEFILVRKKTDGLMEHTGQALFYTYDPSAGKWQLVATNALTIFKPDPESSRRLVPKDYKITYDIQNYKDGTLALTGHDEHWQLVFFHRAGDETAARWAQAQPLQAADTAASSKDTSDALITAARTGNIQHLNQMVSEGASINLRDENGYTLFIHAIDAEQSDTVLWLIRQGADSTITGCDGGTPLTYAAWRDLTNVVIELLARNADPNAGFNNGQTALMLAASNGNLDMVKQLIAKGARTTSMDKAGRTAFMWATYAPKPDVLEYFLKNTTDIRTLNKALFLAVRYNQTNNIALLLKHDADVNTKNEFNTALLIKAAMHSEPETLQFLIDHGAKVNDPSSESNSALMAAAEQNRADNMRVLLRAGADLMYVNTKHEYLRRTVFNYATAPEAKAIVLEALGQYLLRTGKD